MGKTLFIALTICQFLLLSTSNAQEDGISASVFEGTGHNESIVTSQSAVTIVFASQAREFDCSFNETEFQPCVSPYRRVNIPDGRHKLEIRDNLGNLKTILIVVDTLQK